MPFYSHHPLLRDLPLGAKATQLREVGKRTKGAEAETLGMQPL